jgi:hypothetical protein
VRIIVVVVLAAVVAGGCGSSSDGGGAASQAAPTEVTTNPTATRAKARLAPPCSPRARSKLARETGLRPGLIDASPFTAASGASGCRLRGVGGLTVIVQLDSAPQAYTRLERQIVEYGQNVLHSGRQEYPRSIKHLGLDADWLAAENRILTTDGVRLVNVKIGWLRRMVTPAGRSRSGSPASTSGPRTTRTAARPPAATPPGRAPAPPDA